jgi:hypothetical protein
MASRVISGLRAGSLYSIARSINKTTINEDISKFSFAKTPEYLLLEGRRQYN